MMMLYTQRYFIIRESLPGSPNNSTVLQLYGCFSVDIQNWQLYSDCSTISGLLKYNTSLFALRTFFDWNNFIPQPRTSLLSVPYLYWDVPFCPYFDQILSHPSHQCIYKCTHPSLLITKLIFMYAHFQLPPQKHKGSECSVIAQVTMRVIWWDVFCKVIHLHTLVKILKALWYFKLFVSVLQ